jgi:hypothetical protein
LIISDPTNIAPRNADKAQVWLCISESDTNSLLRKFWEDEEIAQNLPLKEEDKKYKKYFVSIHPRTSEDRYRMRLSFKTASPKEIGEFITDSHRPVHMTGE